jgi:multidrug resistance efflux pump
MTTLQRSIQIFGLMALSLTVGAIGMKLLTSKPEAWRRLEAEETELGEESLNVQEAPTAVTIRPKRDESLTINVQNIGTVDAFFQSELRARASGIIRAITKDIGDPVRRGELLLTIDVPDLDQEVFQKESLITQRQQEVRVAETKRDSATAALEVGQATVRQKKTEVDSAHATEELRRKRLERFRTLSGREVVTPDVIEELERDHQAAAAAYSGARVAVEKAEADLNELRTAIVTAQAEVGLRLAMVEVAQRDLDRARALSDYARIRAPFDGVVVRRNVDPGDFVQNATAGTSETLITVARTDFVTIVTRMPENVSSFLTRSTEAQMEFDDLPGVTFSAPITRFAPAVQTSDRTVRVEVDIFNDSSQAYTRLVAQEFALSALPLGATNAGALICDQSVANEFVRGNRKGAADRLPALPMMMGRSSREPRLFPGMVGTIRLQLRRFADAYVLPATAVFSRGGKSYILEVREGVATLTPVVIQVTDGRLAKVAVFTRMTDARGGSREVLQELTGKEEIVANRQLEYTPGKPVRTAPTEW